MVNNEGQIYTMEGIAAAFLMLLTTYIVLSSTTVITPGESHITDMQLETLGNDVLAVMDTPDAFDNTLLIFDQSELELYIEDANAFGPDNFKSRFDELSNRMEGDNSDRIKYYARVYYRKMDDSVESFYFSGYPYYRENAVVVTRWVNIQDSANLHIAYPDVRDEPQTMLLEVTMWRE